MSDGDPDETIRAHVWVTGRVQGVGFRAYVQQAGSYYQLSGWVRNVGDDQVETVAEGPRQKVEQFVASVSRGPRSAHVQEARVDWETPQSETRGFRVRF